jgi:hypothetical protein
MCTLFTDDVCVFRVMLSPRRMLAGLFPVN